MTESNTTISKSANISVPASKSTKKSDHTISQVQPENDQKPEGIILRAPELDLFLNHDNNGTKFSDLKKKGAFIARNGNVLTSIDQNAKVFFLNDNIAR